MTRPAVVIATHQREVITTKNLSLLELQVPRPQIILVVSDTEEAVYYSQRFGGITVVQHPNIPLGAKWQAGVAAAKRFDITHLVVCGSDDILCKGFFERYCGRHTMFTGLQRWYIWDGAVLYLFHYMANQCLGGGRVYRRELLDEYDWNLFDTHANKLLDDYGWNVSENSGRWIEADTGAILAVKGNWPVMNKVGETLRHPNAHLLEKLTGEAAVSVLMDKFGYV